MSWVRVPPEAADFSLKKSLPQVSLNCVVFLCILEGVSKFVYHVYYVELEYCTHVYMCGI